MILGAALRIIPYALSGALVAVLWFFVAQDTREEHNAALTALIFDLRACRATVQNQIEDMESDNEIDNIPDDGLRRVPDRWLRPGAGE